MVIKLADISKKFQKEWVIKNLTLHFEAGSYLVQGPNGSGKSTLLKILSGFTTPSKGEINFTKNQITIPPDQIFKHVSYCAPYIDVFEEYTIRELFQFYCQFKNLLVSDWKEFIHLIELGNIKNKPIKDFSSGMKQRVKLGLSIFSDTDLLLLDEPTSYLDKDAVKWYQNLITSNLNKRIVIVASNSIEVDGFFCNRRINILDYK